MGQHTKVTNQKKIRAWTAGKRAEVLFAHSPVLLSLIKSVLAHHWQDKHAQALAREILGMNYERSNADTGGVAETSP